MEGSIDPELQALPVDTATGSMLATNCLGVGALESEVGPWFGSRRVTSPCSWTPLSLAVSAVTSRSRSTSEAGRFGSALFGGDVGGGSESDDAGDVQ